MHWWRNVLCATELIRDDMRALELRYRAHWRLHSPTIPLFWSGVTSATRPFKDKMPSGAAVLRTKVESGAKTPHDSADRRDGTFVCSCGTKNELQHLTESEAAELMKHKMSDGYDWRWQYTFVTATPRHFSFTVTFGREGRVKDISDVWG